MQEEKRHPIQVVARRTGLTPEVLRVWEKRYRLVTPSRTPTGRRLYSDADVERLRLVRRATLLGRRVGEVSPLSNESLTELAQEDERQILAASPAPPPDSAPSALAGASPPARPGATDTEVFSILIEECMEAIRELDALRLEGILNRALMTAGSTAFVEEIVSPLLRTIGHQWEKGLLDPYYEHLASGVIRQVIARMFVLPAPDPAAPVLVVTTPSGQRHEIGAILAACAAQTEGWRVVFLGPDLPARYIARAAEQAKADAVALSVVYPSDDAGLIAELSDLHRHLPSGVPVLVGGAAAPSYARTLKRIGARIVPDIPTFRSVLGEIRSGRASAR